MGEIERVDTIIEAIRALSKIHSLMLKTVKGVEKEYPEVVLYCLHATKLGMQFIDQFKQP